MARVITREIADRAADIQRRLVLLTQPPVRLTDEQRQQKALAHRQLRQERVVNAGGSFTREDIDHVEPLARGGDNSRYNLQLTCPSCNLKKGAKSPVIFARQMGRLI